MKIATAFFARKSKYNKLLRVMRNSIKKTMPEIKLKIIKMKKPENIDHKRDTAYSFLAAAEYAFNHNSGLLAIADCDLMFLKSIESIKHEKFDIAITVRNKMKFNTGLWFMRPTARAKDFIKYWIEKTKILMNDFCRYEEFCWTYGGIDQASLFLTIEKLKKINILELPCQEWNATQSEWKFVDEKTKVIHIKSKLRLAVFNKIEIDKDGEYNYLLPLVKKWRSYLNATA